MKLCYIVLIHHRFEQAARLLRRLSGEDVSLVVHIDRKVDRAGMEKFASLVQGLHLCYARRVRATWGGYGLAVAIMRGIEAAVHVVGDFDRCVILSGQDYPIASHRDIVEFFNANPSAEYLEVNELDLTNPKKPGWPPYFRFRRFHVWLGTRRVALPWIRKPVPAYRLYHGSGWWALTRDALVHLDETFRRWTSFRWLMQTSFLVDEVHVQTLMMNSSFAANVMNRNVTFAEWSPTSGPHPKTLGIGDLPDLLESRKLFARKFDESLDPGLLNALDSLHAGAS